MDPMDAGGAKCDDVPAGFIFSEAPDVLEFALQDFHRSFLSTEDGGVVGFFLLTSINHWSFEQERLVVVTQRAVYRVKYNFIKRIVEKSTRLPFSAIGRVLQGALMWPDKLAAFMSDQSVQQQERQGVAGVRILESGYTGETSWYRRWNPKAEQPFQTFRSHITKAVDIPKERRHDHSDQRDVACFHGSMPGCRFDCILPESKQGCR